MRAYVLHDINDICLEEVNKPVPGDEEVLVRVKAAGICGSDIPRIYKTGAHVHPIIPGHEFSGVIEEVGNEKNSNLIGQRVGVFPLIPCMECPECKSKKYEMCRHYNYLGSRCDGAFAEYVKVPLWNLIELPDSVSFETAGMLEPLSVAAHAVRGLTEGDVDKSEPILVWGLGTIGLMTVSVLEAEGFKNIICVGSKEYQRNIVKKYTQIHESFVLDAYDCRIEELISERTSGRGPSYAFECVGKNESLEKTVASVAPSGKVMLVGNPYSDMTLSRNIYWKILRNQLTIKGTWNSSFTKEKDDDWTYVLKRLSENTLRTDYLITHKFSIENLNCGFELMRDKSDEYVKCMMVKN